MTKWMKFVAYISVVAVVADVATQGRAFARFGASVNLWKVLAIYLLGGLAAGVISGLLEPFARTWARSMLVGVAYMFPISLMLTLTMYSTNLADPKFWGIAAMFAIWPGSGFGLFDFVHRRLDLP